MKKMNTTPISGTQELLPEKQAIFDEIKSRIREVYQKHGFQNIETPTIDRTEVLFAKAGGDTEKQIYKVIKTAETDQDADQALRFDHTVPLARYVVEHESDLYFPFKVTQIGRNFRGERAQKGRFREFYQCDIDIVGRNNLSIAYDAEAIATLHEALSTFLKPKMLIRISNRKLLTGLLNSQNLESKSKEIFSIIDHVEKVSPEKTQQSLNEINLTGSQIDILNKFMAIQGEREEAVAKLKSLNIEDEIYLQGVSELNQVMSLLELQGLKSQISADMLIVRGLDYYTGTVFETFLPEYREIGSVGSGGRYENLAGHYTDQNFPGIGGSIGLTRLFYVLSEHDLLSDIKHNLIDIAIVPISENEQAYALKVASELRTKNNSVDVILTDKKLGDKLTHAARIAKYGIVIGEDEVKTGDLTLKNFETGEQSKLGA